MCCVVGVCGYNYTVRASDTSLIVWDAVLHHGQASVMDSPPSSDYSYRLCCAHNFIRLGRKDTQG